MVDIYLLKEEYAEELEKVFRKRSEVSKEWATLHSVLGEIKQEFIPKAEKVTLSDLEEGRIYAMASVLLMSESPRECALGNYLCYFVDGEIRCDTIYGGYATMQNPSNPMLLVEYKRNDPQYGTYSHW